MSEPIGRTAEFVLPGHPDRIADAIADHLVQAACERDPDALAGVEVALHRDVVFVDGRIAGTGASEIDVGALVRATYAEVGHDEETPPAPERLRVLTDLCQEPLRDGERELRRRADDQSIVTGYATSIPGTDGLPVEHAVARRLAIALWRLREREPLLHLGPDGKVIVLVEELAHDRHVCTGVSVSLQHRRDWDAVHAHAMVLDALESELHELTLTIPGFGVRPRLLPELNGAGDFIEAGPRGDNGLSGKKLVMDCYGPRVPIGGGAMSGKDFHKADRAGPLIARDLATLAVQRSGCRECTVTLAIFPGETEFRLVHVEAESHLPLDPRRVAALTDRTLESRARWPEGRPPLPELARWGHFAPAPQWSSAPRPPGRSTSP